MHLKLNLKNIVFRGVKMWVTFDNKDRITPLKKTSEHAERLLRQAEDFLFLIFPFGL